MPLSPKNPDGEYSVYIVITLLAPTTITLEIHIEDILYTNSGQCMDHSKECYANDPQKENKEVKD